MPSGPVSENASQWKAFAQSSAYPAVSGEVGELVTEDWLIKNGADYSLPWLAGPENEETENNGSNLFRFHKHRQVWWKRFHGVVIRSPMIPLVLRTIVWIFSLIALILGSSIHKLANKLKSPEVVNGSSPKLAIVVDAIALVYIIYITYDEYTGKPLGLRSATGKMRLVFLDLFFIVFDSANLSLAFYIVSKSNLRCDGDSVDARICHQQKGLASVLLIALIAWLMTFSISMFRYVSDWSHINDAKLKGCLDCLSESLGNEVVNITIQCLGGY